MRLLLVILALSGCPKDQPIDDDTQIKGDSIIQPCSKENCAAVSTPAEPTSKRSRLDRLFDQLEQERMEDVEKGKINQEGVTL